MDGIEINNYIEIKKPLIYLINENGEILWFYDYKKNIICLEKIGINFPRWIICIQSREEMIENVKASIKCGKIIEYINNEFKLLLNN